jgi:hypothetical protein
MPGYYQRQTCLNGHIISNSVGTPHGNAHMQAFCSKCGEETIVSCPSCGTPQHGNLKDVMPFGDSKADAYCWNCGKPYPWTERQFAATAELVNEEEQLSEQDKRLLTSSLSDLASDTPNTALAATRFRRIVAKAGGTFKTAMYKFIVDFCSETAKKIVLGE